MVLLRMLALTCLSLLLGPMIARAADAYPGHYITLIVPYPPGGPTDTYGRLIAEAMSRDLGQQVVIENVGGAGGTIGTAKVAAAAPDGYTLLIHQVGLPISATLFPKLRYDVTRDLTGIGLVNQGPTLILGRKSLPANSMAELIAWMRAPGHVTKFAHAGAGSYAHLCAVVFADAVNAKVDLIPYRGGGPALNDVVANQVDLTCSSLTAGEFVRTGAVKAFGLTGKERSKALPDVPTLAEAGYPNVELNSWHALYTRAGTPPAIIARLTKALQVALADKKVVAAFEQTGVFTYPVAEQTPDATMKLLRSEIKVWGDVIRAHNIAPPG